MKRHYKILILVLLTHVTSVLANGDAVYGKILYESRCNGCHSLDVNRVGPAHRGVFGRYAGDVQGYDYSDAIKNSNVVWTTKNLDRWLNNPEALIPGQKIGYSMSDAKDRADVIAYLMTVKDTQDSIIQNRSFIKNSSLINK